MCKTHEQAFDTTFSFVKKSQASFRLYISDLISKVLILVSLNQHKYSYLFHRLILNQFNVKNYLKRQKFSIENLKPLIKE